MYHVGFKHKSKFRLLIFICITYNITCIKLNFVPMISLNFNVTQSRSPLLRHYYWQRKKNQQDCKTKCINK